LPRAARRPFCRWICTSNRRAVLTASRLVRAPVSFWPA
jgi:hypothetical protein